MSGLYIKGFQLPEKNDLYYVKVECEPGKNPVATIWRKDVLGSMSFGVFECIPVPDHGRMVDADAFREEMDKHYPFDKFTQSKHGDADAAKGTIIMMLANAPTIIPTDRKGGGG